MKGRKCSNIHGNPNDTQICRDHRRGACKFSATCKYRHSVFEQVQGKWKAIRSIKQNINTRGREPRTRELRTTPKQKDTKPQQPQKKSSGRVLIRQIRPTEGPTMNYAQKVTRNQVKPVPKPQDLAFQNLNLKEVNKPVIIPKPEETVKVIPSTMGNEEQWETVSEIEKQAPSPPRTLGPPPGLPPRNIHQSAKKPKLPPTTQVETAPVQTVPAPAPVPQQQQQYVPNQTAMTQGPTMGSPQMHNSVGQISTQFAHYQQQQPFMIVQTPQGPMVAFPAHMMLQHQQLGFSAPPPPGMHPQHFQPPPPHLPQQHQPPHPNQSNFLPPQNPSAENP